MQTHQRLILLAHPRSGSSSLFQILQLHPRLSILEEPFNEDFTAWNPANTDYLSRIVDVSSLDAQLADIFASYNGLKLLDYQLPDEMLAHLLQREDVIVLFLRRNNLLQAVVSALIAEQTQLWKKWDMTRPLADYYTALQPLDIDDVARRVGDLDQHLQFCESLLAQRSAGTYLSITYEALYYAAAAEQAALLAAIWRLLDLPPPQSDRVQYYLSPAEVKINSAATYALLPNAREIDDRCGNDRTGRLFDPATSQPVAPAADAQGG